MTLAAGARTTDPGRANTESGLSPPTTPPSNGPPGTKSSSRLAWPADPRHLHRRNPVGHPGTWAESCCWSGSARPTPNSTRSVPTRNPRPPARPATISGPRGTRPGPPATRRCATGIWRKRKPFAKTMADRADWEHVTQHTRHMAVAADAELRRRHPDQRIDPLRSGEPAHRGDWARAAGMRSPTQLGLGSASSCGPSPLWGHSRWPSSAGAESMH